MPRLHDETILENIWGHEILQEASVLSQFFVPSEKSTKHLQMIHKEIGISADTTPIIPIRMKTVSGKVPYIPRGKFDDKNLTRATWIRKQDEIQDLLQASDGLFVVNPTSKTRVIIRQKLSKKGSIPENIYKRVADKKARIKAGSGEKLNRGDVKGAKMPTQDPYLQPQERELRHLPFVTTYNIWIFEEDGRFREHELRHLTGEYEDKGVKPDIDSNLWVHYMDRDARAYRIPNFAFRGKLDEPPVPGSIGLKRPDDSLSTLAPGNELKPNRATIHKSPELVQNIITKYGNVIKNHIRKALEPLGNAITKIATNADVPEDLLQQVMDDLKVFKKLSSKLETGDIEPSLKEFLDTVISSSALSKKYNIELGIENMLYFKPGEDTQGIRKNKPLSEPKFNVFVRDFILYYMKQFSPKRFENRFIKYMEDLF